MIRWMFKILTIDLKMKLTNIIFTEQGSVIESPGHNTCTFGTFGVLDLAYFLRCDWLTQEMLCSAVL